MSGTENLSGPGTGQGGTGGPTDPKLAAATGFSGTYTESAAQGQLTHGHPTGTGDAHQQDLQAGVGKAGPGGEGGSLGGLGAAGQGGHSTGESHGVPGTGQGGTGGPTDPKLAAATGFSGTYNESAAQGQLTHAHPTGTGDAHQQDLQAGVGKAGPGGSQPSEL